MYCQSCGAQVTGAFCTKCGNRVSELPPPPPTPPPAYSATPPPPPYSQPLPPPAKSGAGMKILFVALGIVGLMGVLFIGGLMFAWHKAKQAAALNGIDLSGLTETHHGPTRRLNACELLTREDLSQILNLNVERVEGTGSSTHSTCRYYSAAAQQRGTDEAAAAMKKLEDASKSDASNAGQAERIKDLGNMIRGVTSAAAGASNAPMLTIETESGNARAAMVGFKIGMGLGNAVVTKGADPSASALMREDVKGVGDEAMFGPLLSLFMFRKGDVSVQLDGRTLPGGREAQIAIAKRIVSRL